MVSAKSVDLDTEELVKGLDSADLYTTKMSDPADNNIQFRSWGAFKNSSTFMHSYTA